METYALKDVVAKALQVTSKTFEAVEKHDKKRKIRVSLKETDKITDESAVKMLAFDLYLLERIYNYVITNPEIGKTLIEFNHLNNTKNENTD